MVEEVDAHPLRQNMLITTSCLPVKSTTLSTLSMTQTHAHAPWDLCEERGGESVWQVKEAPLCSWLLLLCMCVDDRGLHSLCRMRCLQNTFLIRQKSMRTPPLRSLSEFVGKVAALLSHIHLFYLGWQSCLINWILNKPSQKISFHQFFYLTA